MFILLRDGKLIDTTKSKKQFRIKGSSVEVVDYPQIGWSERIGMLDCYGETKEEIEWKRNRYEGWTAEDFKNELERYFNPANFDTREEVSKWTADNQPYYKKAITIVVDYFYGKVLDYKASFKLSSVFGADLESILYQQFCVGCENEKRCHEECEKCDDFLEALESNT